ncbi:nitrilase-related carbon-nitrogen hydrolase [Chloroflexota bacterium]
MRQLRIGMAQINTTVGDFAGNRRKILKAIDEARSSGVELLTFPELLAETEGCPSPIDSKDGNWLIYE